MRTRYKRKNRKTRRKGRKTRRGGSVPFYEQSDAALKYVMTRF